MGELSIGLVVPAFDKGGLEQVVLNLYREFKAAGHRCVILVERNECGYLSSLVPKDDVFIFNGDEALFVHQLMRNKIDVLHYHYSVFGLEGAALLGLYTIYTLHNVYTWLSKEEMINRGRIISKAARIVAVSSFVKSYFCKHSGVSADRVDVVSNGVNVDFPSGKLIARERITANTGAYIFGHVASFHRVKHQSILIGAAERLSKKYSNFHIAMIGNVGDPNYFQEIRNLILMSPANKHISITGYLTREEMMYAYQKLIDCVLLPTLQEGCSNVVQESLAFGKRMILTDVGNAQDAKFLSNEVVIIPSAEDIDELDLKKIEDLSHKKDCRNLEELVDAMETAMRTPYQSRYNPVVAEAVSVKSMAGNYLKLIYEDDLQP